MIEKQQYELYDVNEGDDTVYDIGGFDPEIMLLKKMFTKLRKKKNRTIIEGLEQYMEEKLDEDNLMITDTHFDTRNDNVNFNEYFYQFYEGVFFPYLQQNNIKTCIHLGDCFDK